MPLGPMRSDLRAVRTTVKWSRADRRPRRSNGRSRSSPSPTQDRRRCRTLALRIHVAAYGGELAARPRERGRWQARRIATVIAVDAALSGAAARTVAVLLACRALDARGNRDVPARTRVAGIDSAAARQRAQVVPAISDVAGRRVWGPAALLVAVPVRVHDEDVALRVDVIDGGDVPVGILPMRRVDDEMVRVGPGHRASAGWRGAV